MLFFSKIPSLCTFLTPLISFAFIHPLSQCPIIKFPFWNQSIQTGCLAPAHPPYAGESLSYALWWEAEPTPTSILQKLVTPGHLFRHSLQQDAGFGHLRHPDSELETVKQGSRASSNTGVWQKMQRDQFSGSINLFGLP